jgi:hypothetical protein
MIEDTEVDSKLVQASNKTAQSITALTNATLRKVNSLKLALVMTAGDRVRDGVTQLVGIASLKANESVIGFTATKYTFCGVALDLIEKEPKRDWDCEELLSVAERTYRYASAQAKGVEGALKGAEGAKAIIHQVKDIDTLKGTDNVVGLLPKVVARTHVAGPHALTIDSALRALETAIQQSDSLAIEPETIDTLVHVLALLAQIQRNMAQAA